ncbi:MAG: type IX secretion system membrane protein PorP/SprF [Elusimicrobiota bacterium]|nr:type IX secretion system membrane protein PorP/SprF [Endomicrobiia bacterium]MDW8165079.1 type IX secretion system membrane protein PorP/SprF [Elusimicrobiota bacterium]
MKLFIKLKLTILSGLFLLVESIYSFNEFVGHSARTKAMGDVVCGVADSVDSIYYNPAGLHTLSAPQISLGYQVLWMLLTETDTLGSGYISMCYPFKKVGSLGLSYSNFNISNLYQEHIAILTYSNKISSPLYLGVNLKYLGKFYTVTDEIVNNTYFTLYGSKVSDFSFDIGLLYKKEKISLGVSAQNLNQPNLALNPDEKDHLKLKINTGFGIFPTKTFIMGLDINYDDILKMNLGLEKNFPTEGISIRAGGNYDLNGSAEASLGFGYRIPVSFGGIVLNYSFSYPITQIVNTAGHHFVSFLIDFNKQVSQKEGTFTLEKQKVAKYGDTQQLKEEIVKSLKPQVINLEISKEVIRKEDKDITFKIEISTPIIGWQLIIADNKQKVVKKFYYNTQQQQIVWDLKTDEGKYISPGKYNCFVVGIDKKENKIESPIKTFILSEKLQQETLQQEMIICPNCGAENLKGERFCVRCREPL